MQLTFKTIVAIAAIEAFGQVQALELQAQQTLTTAQLELAAVAKQQGGLQYTGYASLTQLGNVLYHDIQGQASQSIAGSKLRIMNEANGPIYINYQAKEYLWPNTLRIDPGKAIDYDIPVGRTVSSVRFWPKYDCDSKGENCTFGESGGPNLPCPPKGCSPPIDSKFEATFGASNGTVDWYNASQVDGWTLPYHMKFTCGDAMDPNSADLNCQGLKQNVCPTQNIAGAGNVPMQATNPDKGDKYAGCYSPCGLLTYNNWKQPYGKFKPSQAPADQYCCAGDFNTPDTCHTGPNDTMTYTQVVHSHCDTYAWAYDDAVGLKACKSDQATFAITFYDPIAA